MAKIQAQTWHLFPPSCGSFRRMPMHLVQQPINCCRNQVELTSLLPIQGNHFSTAAVDCAYPNPASDAAYVNIDLVQPTKNVVIQVYDIHGKMVRNITHAFLSSGTHKISLDVEELSSGNYIVSMQAGSKQGVGKFIKVN